MKLISFAAISLLQSQLAPGHLSPSSQDIQNLRILRPGYTTASSMCNQSQDSTSQSIQKILKILTGRDIQQSRVLLPIIDNSNLTIVLFGIYKRQYQLSIARVYTISKIDDTAQNTLQYQDDIVQGIQKYHGILPRIYDFNTKIMPQGIQQPQDYTTQGIHHFLNYIAQDIQQYQGAIAPDIPQQSQDGATQSFTAI
ncbi:hypothetical protein BASA83_002206 [Batrachochytrium salamandrivorans]|nr:hypothetical protein BASA83_002206 [Batrachochytrium salamandrivorans]